MAGERLLSDEDDEAIAELVVEEGYSWTGALREVRPDLESHPNERSLASRVKSRIEKRTAENKDLGSIKRLLKMNGVDKMAVAKAVADAMGATRANGVPDHSTRLRAASKAGEYMELDPAKKVEADIRSVQIVSHIVRG